MIGNVLLNMPIGHSYPNAQWAKWDVLQLFNIPLLMSGNALPDAMSQRML